MVLEIAAKGSVNVDKNMATVQDEMKELQRCANEDIEVSNSFRNARKMPKVTETEKVRRQKFLTETLISCVEVPFAAAMLHFGWFPFHRNLASKLQ